MTAFVAAAVATWATAVAQLSNADQLVNGFLFESAQTFSGATFPLEHTQLLKWPLFAVLGLVHHGAGWYSGLTMLVALTTIAGFAYGLCTIARSTAARNILILLFISVLLLVPAQVFDGGLSAPLGLSMLTGRNIEYLAYFGVLALYLISSSHLRSWQWFGGTVLLSVLFASDQLFVFISLAGSVLFGVAAFVIHPAYRQLSRTWLAGGVAAWLVSQLLLLAVGHITHVASYPLGYTTVNNLPGAWLAITGTLQALALNFGLTARGGMWSFPALAINLITTGLVIWAAIWTLRRIPARPVPSKALLFAGMCLATIIAAICGYAAMSHPYLQDARYLTVCLFAGFAILAVWLRTVRVPSPKLIIACAVCAVALATFASVQHTNELRSHDPLAQRNQKIADILSSHHVAFLVGNYWRVMPIRMIKTDQKISPLQGCRQNAPVLSSSTWRPALLKQSFAYLITTQSTSVPQPACNKHQITQRFGTPSGEIIIDGNQKTPREELLFYDNGASIVLPSRP